MFKPTQVLSTILSGVLVASSIPLPARAFGEPAATMPAFVKTFTPAEDIGYVASSYSPDNNNSRPRMIVIADLHGHVEVQHHIVDMLDSFVHTLTSSGPSQANVPIFVEGGWVDHLEHPLKSVKNSAVRSTMAEYFLEKAEIPATQAFSERYPNATNFTLTGVENKDEYEANRQRFAQSYPIRKAVLEAIVRREQAVADVSGNVQVRDYRALQAVRTKYEKGLMGGDQYAAKLVRYAKHYGVRGGAVDTLRDASAATAGDLEIALQDVNRAVAQKISESRPFASYFRHNGGEDAILRSNIAKIDSYLDLLKRLVGDQLTPAEVPMVYERLADLTQVAKTLLADSHLNINIGEALREALSFYPFAMMRDNSLVQNSLTALDKKASTGTGIFVVGGFHAGAITDYLREHKISYLLINPVISRDISAVEQLNYAKRVCNEHVTKAEAAADFSSPRGKQQLSASDSATGAYTDLPGAVQPSVAATPATEETLENPGKGESTELAGGRMAIAGLIGKSIAGVSLVSPQAGDATATGIVESVDGASRAAAVADVVRSLNAKFSFDPENGGTITRTGDNTYAVTGSQMDNIQPILASVLNVARQQGTPVQSDKIHVVMMDQDAMMNFSLNPDLISPWRKLYSGMVRFGGHVPVLRKYKETFDQKADDLIGRLTGEQRAFVHTLADGTSVVFINKKFSADRRDLESGFAKAAKGEQLTGRESDAVNGAHHLTEELTHRLTAVGRQGHVGEGSTGALALYSLFGMAANGAKTITAQSALNILQVLDHSPNKSAVKTMLETTAENGVHHIEGLLDKLNNAIDIKQQRQTNAEELQDLVGKMKIKFPTFTEFEIKQVENEQDGFVRRLVVGTTLESRMELALAQKDNQEGKARRKISLQS